MTNLPRVLDSIPSSVITSAKLAYTSDPVRSYHDWNHALDVLNYVSQVQWDHATEAALAALFHDAIYTVGAKDNEKKSVEFFMETWESFGKEADRVINKSLVKKMIMGTARHLDATEGDMVNQPTEVLKFMDCDMAGLGLPFMQFNANSRKVEAECLTHYDAESFLHGRKRFWEKLLTRDTIFHTTEFSSLEWRARKNIATELHYLRQGIAPSGMAVL